MKIERVILDTKLVSGLMNESLFEALNTEIKWHQVTHKGGQVPRLMAIQSTQEEGFRPIYRHPMDTEPSPTDWTLTVSKIKHKIENEFGLSLNHCLCQLYRDGSDRIGQHSDKTLDITPGSLVCNYSAGSTRKMRFTNKLKNNTNVFVDLEDDSVLLMGLETNQKYMHEIKTQVNAAPRISLTFRSISTFYDGQTIKGQGASSTKRDDLNELLKVFSNENKNPDFEWNEYKGGFNHIVKQE